MSSVYRQRTLFPADVLSGALDLSDEETRQAWEELLLQRATEGHRWLPIRDAALLPSFRASLRSPWRAATQIGSIYDPSAVPAKTANLWFFLKQDHDAKAMSDDWQAVGRHLWIAVADEVAAESPSESKEDV
ncbi:MAG: hypothetical protein HYS13_03110 [Planctomycetia bacterium]|nr:hypothetical protein [Planctomycetia bacterium]